MNDMLQIADHKNLKLTVEEQVVCGAVIMCSGFTLEAIRSKSRTQDYVLARSVLGLMLNEIGCSLTRAGEIVNRDHASILHYKRNHAQNLLYQRGYKDLYESANLEHYTTHRVRTVDAMEKELLIMQETLDKYKRTFVEIKNN